MALAPCWPATVRVSACPFQAVPPWTWSQAWTDGLALALLASLPLLLLLLPLPLHHLGALLCVPDLVVLQHAAFPPPWPLRHQPLWPLLHADALSLLGLL